MGLPERLLPEQFTSLYCNCFCLSSAFLWLVKFPVPAAQPCLPCSPLRYCCSVKAELIFVEACEIYQLSAGKVCIHFALLVWAGNCKYLESLDQVVRNKAIFSHPLSLTPAICRFWMKYGLVWLCVCVCMCTHVSACVDTAWKAFSIFILSVSISVLRGNWHWLQHNVLQMVLLFRDCYLPSWTHSTWETFLNHLLRAWSSCLSGRDYCSTNSGSEPNFYRILENME